MKQLLIACVCLALAGCDKKTDTPAGSGPTSTDDKKVELTDEDVPVRADFAEEAEGAINKDNYKGELDKLTAEIEKE